MVGERALDERAQEQRDHTRIRRARILSRAEHVEVANRHRLEAIEPREQLHVLLAHQLLQRVGRQRIGRHVLALRQGRRVAVCRRRAGINHALDAGSRAATSRLSVASTLARCDVIGSSIDRGTDGIAAWCSTSSTPSTGLPRNAGIGQIACQQFRPMTASRAAASQIFELAGDEAVDHAHAMCRGEQLFDQVRADEAGAAGDEV